jgi:hypothetical protein
MVRAKGDIKRNSQKSVRKLQEKIMKDKKDEPLDELESSKTEKKMSARS